MESDVHIQIPMKKSILQKDTYQLLYPTVCGDWVDAEQFGYGTVQVEPTCMGCILVRFVEESEDGT
jgi:hypothetical protein